MAYHTTINMPRLTKKLKLSAFLTVYFYEVEELLNKHQDQLTAIKYQSEESNTDEFIKQFLKEILLENHSILQTKLKSISFENSSYNKPIFVKQFNEFRITDVLLPSNLSKQQKDTIAKSKKSVYTNPDLLLEIEGYNEIYYESIEIKSTKNNTIPGSSIQQINPYEWVIFLKRSTKSVSVSTGKYVHSITDKLPFPDRSPRPIIGFKTLSDWNKKHRHIDDNCLIINEDKAKEKQKLKLLADWQDFLAEEWMAIILAKKKTTSEKWFNNALRKFAIKLLNHSKNQSETELESLISDLKRLLK